MAEEFVNKMNKIEEKVDALGETLMRMITILGSVTELKSDIRMAKEELSEELKKMPTPAPATPGVTKEEISEMLAAMPKAESGGGSSISAEEVSQIVKAELAGILDPILASIESLQESLQSKIDEIDIPEPIVVTSDVGASTLDNYPPPSPGGSISPDRGMKVADELDNILGSLKMGCVAGDVLDVMNESKSAIMEIVLSDPIMVKIDKWAGLVSTYSKRHELQAKDILKLKKDLREEIPKYRPA